MHQASDDLTTYEIDLKLTEAEIRDLAEALEVAITANSQILDHLQQIHTKSAQRGAKETIAILGRLASVKNRCATLLATFPKHEAGWRRVTAP